jgi:uncharacterized protein YjiS (DUF1127 family)
MSMTHRAAEPALAAQLMSYVSGFFKQRWRAYQAWRKRRRLQAFLYGLSDRSLKDIGIARAEIEWLALNGSDERFDPRRHHDSSRR